MKTALSVVFALACLFSASAVAQQVDLRSQMGEEAFRSAGLDKLSDAELANLSRWLQARLDGDAKTVAEAAREEGRKEVVRQNRGFFDFGSSEPIRSTIVGEFRGFGPKGTVWQLANGQSWEQTEAASLAGVRKTAPEVAITPGMMGSWFMKIAGYNTQVRVRRVK